jgi:hypothetical protein
MRKRTVFALAVAVMVFLPGALVADSGQTPAGQPSATQLSLQWASVGFNVGASSALAGIEALSTPDVRRRTPRVCTPERVSKQGGPAATVPACTESSFSAAGREVLEGRQRLVINVMSVRGEPGQRSKPSIPVVPWYVPRGQV